MEINQIRFFVAMEINQKITLKKYIAMHDLSRYKVNKMTQHFINTVLFVTILLKYVYSHQTKKYLHQQKREVL